MEDSATCRKSCCHKLYLLQQFGVNVKLEGHGGVIGPLYMGIAVTERKVICSARTPISNGFPELMLSLWNKAQLGNEISSDKE